MWAVRPKTERVQIENVRSFKSTELLRRRHHKGAKTRLEPESRESAATRQTQFRPGKTRTRASTPAIFPFLPTTCQISRFCQTVFGGRLAFIHRPSVFPQHQIWMKCKVSTAAAIAVAVAATTLPRSTSCYSSPSPPTMGRAEKWSRRTENVFTSGVVWHNFVAFSRIFFFFDGGKICHQLDEKKNENSFIPERRQH